VSARVGRVSGVVLACLLAFAGCSIEEPLPPGEPSPGFDLPRLGGGRLSSDALRGKPILVDFWATWCPPCVLEVPELNAFHGAYADRIAVVAISIDEEPEAELAAWAAEHGLAYPVALGTLDVARDWGAEQFPYHVLVSAEGRVLERLTPGFHDREELEELLKRHGLI
jgi:thiol-disulfide isomerase/thioredoxin